MPKTTLMPKSVDDVLKEFEKKHGLKIGAPEKVTGMTTGNLAIDWQTGAGGIPIGRITELYGYESSGKTTTALQTAVQCQQRIIASDSDQRIIYLDFEHALDVEYAADLGLDLEHPSFVPLQPNNLEQGAKVALDLIETGKVPLLVFDSVAAMSPMRHKDGEFDQATIQMHRAKLISALCQSMIDLIHIHKTAVIFINHKMESIDMSGRPGMPPRVTTPGGRGLKYYASLRLEFDNIGGVKGTLDNMFTGESSSELVANRVMVKCVKNKVGFPGRKVEIRSRYGKGFDNAWSALQLLLANKLIGKNGAWFTITPQRTPTLTDVRRQFHGEQDMLDLADKDPAWRKALIAVATELVDTFNPETDPAPAPTDDEDTE